MKYEKPNITTLASATCAIQRQIKDNTHFADGLSPKLSVNAYEADE